MSHGIARMPKLQADGGKGEDKVDSNAKGDVDVEATRIGNGSMRDSVEQLDS